MTAAKQIFDVLPEDGSFITGKQLKDALPDVGPAELRKAKMELRENGRVQVGRGRGGKIARFSDAAPPEEPQKKTKEEAMAIAREELKHLSREQKQREARSKRKETIKEFVAKDQEISAERIMVDFTGQEESPLVSIWNEETIGFRTAKSYRIKDEILLQEGLV